MTAEVECSVFFLIELCCIEKREVCGISVKGVQVLTDIFRSPSGGGRRPMMVCPKKQRMLGTLFCFYCCTEIEAVDVVFSQFREKGVAIFV